MRISRKRARRLAELHEKEAERARKEKEQEEQAAAEAKARYEAACKGAILPSRRYPHHYRMTRAPRRAMLLQKARARIAKQAAVTAAFSTACLSRLLGTAAAAYHDPMHDMEGELNSLRDQRDELRVYQQAATYLREARERLQDARKDLVDAKAGVASSKQYVEDAKKDLAASQQALANAKEYLRQARALSVEKTQAAIAAQQAAYDYQQEVYARQAAVDELSAEQAEAEAQADAAAEAAGVTSQADSVYQLYSNREAAVQKALAEVGYEQNRLAEAIRLADEYTNGTIVQEGADAEAAEAAAAAAEAAQAEADAWSARADEIAAALDEAEASLDEAQSYLEELEDARADAEAEEADARADERAAEADEAQAEHDLAESEANLAQAQEDQKSAEEWEKEAIEALDDATKDEEETARDLFHFGEGAGLQVGVEYAHAQGNLPRTRQVTPTTPAPSAIEPTPSTVHYTEAYRGHQLYFPLAFYESVRLDKYPGAANVVADEWPGGEARHSLDLGISTGWLDSTFSGPNDHSAGMIDTTLSATYHNDHPIGSVRYGLAVNLPTGEHRFYQNALVPRGLSLFEDFGKGWEFTPSIEAIHRVTERDRLSARFAYTFRNRYAFSKEQAGAETDPGDIATLNLSYHHIGEQHQLHTWLMLSDTGWTTQSELNRREDGTWVLAPQKAHYREGTEVEAGAAANWQIGPKDELGAFLTLGHSMAVHGIGGIKATDDYEVALGLRHTMTPRLSWEGLVSRYHSSTGYNSLYIDDGSGSGPWTRWSLLGVLDYRMTDKDRLTLNIERYLRDGLRGYDYQGYAVALWYTRSF